ncbi:MAG: ParB/RepB/Spo0J family partition protein [Firmicutes bacterium]|nr:ParB/RepB/Spo0J family partition protein [Bacillota bacterium]
MIIDTEQIKILDIDERIKAINDIKIALHEISPFKNEPVDCVIWVKSDEVTSNAYNPNKVAPAEMKLLELSIKSDGYTQPIVTYGDNGYYEVVDGFHRYLIGTKKKEVKNRVNGYLPITRINAGREDLKDRMASTIRHNRARGKHTIDGMSNIVQDLVKRNWSDSRIAKELGMDSDEVLRLKQISGLAELFSYKEFSEAWELE